MLRYSLLVLTVILYSSVEGKYIWGRCPSVPSTIVDFKEVQGEWTVYARNPSLWTESCFNYTINTQNEVTERHFNSYKLFRTTSTNKYELIRHLNSTEFTLRKTYLKYFKTSYTWTVTDAQFNSYMVLYRCGWSVPWVLAKAEVQIWTRNADFTDAIPVPKPIIAALEKVKLTVDDLQLKKKSDC